MMPRCLGKQDESLPKELAEEVEWLNVVYKCESWKAEPSVCSGAEIKAWAYIHIK